MSDMAPVQDPNTLTEADYDIDPATLLQSMGVNPGSVKQDSFNLRIVDRKVIVEYTVIRAVTPKVFGVAMLRSAQANQIEDAEPTPPPNAEVIPMPQPEVPMPEPAPPVPPQQPGESGYQPQQFPALVPEEQDGEHQP